MPSEQPHPVERWLEAYSRQRKNAAGRPFELPWRTRQQLHAEIKRQYPAVARRGGWPWITMGSWWPRLAWGGVAFAVLAMATLLIFPFWRETPRPLALAQRSVEPSSAPAQPAPVVVTAPAPATPALKVGQKADQLASMSADKQARYGFSASSLALSNTARARQLADLAGNELAEPIRLHFTRTNLVLASAPATATSYRLAEGRVRSSARPGLSSRAGSNAEPSASPMKAKTPSAPAFSVLQRFEWEQQGAQLRLIDADGSVYSGAISQMATTKVAKVASSEAKPTIVSKPGTPSGPAGSVKSQLADQPLLDRDRSEASTLGGRQTMFHFTVSGANRTLGQKVELQGQLVLEAATSAASQLGRVGGAKVEGEVWSRRWLEEVQARPGRLILEGQAVVGPTNRLRIQATPEGH